MKLIDIFKVGEEQSREKEFPLLTKDFFWN